MSRKITHTLCQEVVYHIDMTNTHPILLSCYFQYNGINYFRLDSYIENREEYMADWMAQNNETGDDRLCL